MTLNCTAYLKSMHFCNHKDPPFDMKCQLMSADPLPAVKIDLKYSVMCHMIFSQRFNLGADQFT